MEIIDNQPDQHWGSYDAVAHDFETRMMSPFGAEQRPMLQSVAMPPAPGGPDWGQLLSAAWRQEGAIRILQPPAAQAVVAALAFMTAPALPPGTSGGSEWQANPSPTPNAWAQSYIGSGYTVLVDVTSPIDPSGARMVAIVDPGASAAINVGVLAGPAGRYAVVDGPAEVIQAAAAGAQPTPQPGPPPGQPAPPTQAGWSTSKKLVVGYVVLVVAGAAIYAVAKKKK